MLLRWLVNNYLREAAEGKVREVVADVLKRPGSMNTASPPSASPPLNPEPRTLNPSPEAAAPAEVVPCDAAFIFALDIESGGLADRLQGAEISRHSHGTERAGKLAGREVVIVESGVGA